MVKLEDILEHKFLRDVMGEVYDEYNSQIEKANQKRKAKSIISEMQYGR